MNLSNQDFGFNQIISNESIVYNTHLSNITKHIPDGYFDYVIDDVPYGINVANMAFLKEVKTTVKQKNGNRINPNKNKKKYSFKELRTL